MAKLDRERRMRERRLDKQARKDARKQMAAAPVDPTTGQRIDASVAADDGQPALRPARPALSDA